MAGRAEVKAGEPGAFIAVLAWTEAGRVTKHADFETEADAEAHAARFADAYPGAFVAANPGGGAIDWLVAQGTLAVQARTPVDGMTLAEAQAWANAVVNRARLGWEAGPDNPRITVTVGETEIPVDTRDERDLSRLDTLGGLATLALVTANTDPFTFRDADNADHALVPAAVAAMVAAVAHGINQRAVARSWAIKDEVAAAGDAAAVLAILEREGLPA